MNLPKAWNAKLGVGSFLPSKNLYRKCVQLKLFNRCLFVISEELYIYLLHGFHIKVQVF